MAGLNSKCIKCLYDYGLGKTFYGKLGKNNFIHADSSKESLTCVRSGMSPLSMPTCCGFKNKNYLVEIKKN